MTAIASAHTQTETDLLICCCCESRAIMYLPMLFRRVLQTAHPDKGGSAEAYFKVWKSTALPGTSRFAHHPVPSCSQGTRGS